jgi:hypothetical protein
VSGPDDLGFVQGEFAGEGVHESYGDEVYGPTVILVALAVEDLHCHVGSVVGMGGDAEAAGSAREVYLAQVLDHDLAGDGLLARGLFERERRLLSLLSQIAYESIRKSFQQLLHRSSKFQ